MAIKASDLRKSAEGDTAALQQSQAPDVRIGGDLVVGGDLAVPAGQTWEIDGDAVIGSGAEIRIEHGATLALTGKDADRAAGGSEYQPLIKRLTAPPSHQAAGGNGQQRLITLRIPAEGAAVRWALEPSMAERMAAQLTSGMAPAEFDSLAAELMRPPEAGRQVAALMAGLAAEYQTSWAESIRQAVEPAALNAALSAASEAMRQALELPSLRMMNEAIEMLNQQGKRMAESLTSWVQPFDLNIAQSALSNFNIGHGALVDLDMLRNRGFSLGALDDTNRAIDRLHERRQAAAVVWRPEPPAERVQVVHLPANYWKEVLTHALTNGQASRRDVAEFLYSSFIANMSEPGQPPADWTQIETVAVLYRDQGHLHSKQEAFVMWVRSSSVGRALGLSQLSRATFQRWLTIYEQMMGEKVRPGRGNRKRKQL